MNALLYAKVNRASTGHLFTYRVMHGGKYVSSVFETIMRLHEPRVILFGEKRPLWLFPLCAAAGRFVHVFCSLVFGLLFLSDVTCTASRAKEILGGGISAQALSAKDCGATSMGHRSPAKTTKHCGDEQSRGSKCFIRLH